jgi:hypothetical protein
LNADQRHLLIGGLRALVTAFKVDRRSFHEVAATSSATLEPLQALLESLGRAAPATDQGCAEVWRLMERFESGRP